MIKAVSLSYKESGNEVIYIWQVIYIKDVMSCNSQEMYISSTVLLVRSHKNKLKLGLKVKVLFWCTVSGLHRVLCIT